MNIARILCHIRHENVGKNIYRKFRLSALKYESTQASQPQIKEEKYDFEDLQINERAERRKPKIEPFMKNVFVSIFDRELLAYPEILNKTESQELDNRVALLSSVFSDPQKTRDDRKNALIKTSMYAAPVSLTKGGLAALQTECLRYLETISNDLQLAQEISDHWVSLEALQLGLSPEQFQQVVDDLTKGDKAIALCIKEKLSERLLQPDFRTKAELDGQGIWRITGEKVCHQGDGYCLVLCLVEAGHYKAFLVHPKVAGVTYNDMFVTFHNTPATPLDFVSETALGSILAKSRLHAATICRSHLQNTMKYCAQFVKPKYLSGKPLSELSTIRSKVGDALTYIYASESAEYFTAGLIDGYMEPDADLEMAMCRNFMATHGVNAMLRLLTIPALEKQEECNKLLNDMRYLVERGETVDGINLYIALQGIHHAGKSMAEEVKKIRNPLFNPTFILKKMVTDRHQEKDDPKLNLFLAEHLHPTLRPPSELLEYAVLRMRFATETLMARHGMEVSKAFTELNRLSEAATEIYMMTAVLARASRAYCIGLRNAELEMKLAGCFTENSKLRVQKLIKDIDNGEFLNLDHYIISFGRRVLEPNVTEPSIMSKPTDRVFW